ncbi:DNA-directed RNA polymerase subunit delta [Spirochaetia bacterium]|nr:DNA-directed RNA polymerase subunit delta [Spirochaetia bacterium]
MHGVIASIDPSLRVNDVSHLIPPFRPWSASYCLKYTSPCWPRGTIFVSVVDPGVGTARRASVAKTALGQYVVTPDNGTLTHIKYFQGIEEIREIDENKNRRPGTEKFNTFHGRDIFAYTAGRLAAGIISYEDVGPLYPVEEIISFPITPSHIEKGRAEGIVENTDSHFGSILFNITIDDFEKAGFKMGDTIAVEICSGAEVRFSGTVLYQPSFGYVGLGEPVIFNGSTGYISMGVNRGSFSEKYHIQSGNEWTVRFNGVV